MYMKRKVIIAGLVSAAAAATAQIISPVQDVNGFLPEEVLIRTQTQTFCKYGQFVLVDGRIYAKLPGEANWHLFLKKGLPFSKSKKPANRFETPERINEISADEYSLYAFDSNGIMYTCFLNKKNVRLKAFRWNRLFGFPKDSTTILRQNDLVSDKKAFSLGSRRGEVLYHSDIFGNEHHFGTMGIDTVYFLNHEGTQIRFTDSGLPPDFSRQIQMPEKGRFIAQNMSVSGETIFLIGNQGSMYTRLIDFDTMGCDPMFFEYTYDKVEQKYDGANYLSNYSPWGLPAEDWLKHESIPLKGKARLTKYNHINSNGQGNFARTMRVVGLDENGETGYYEKEFLDKEWHFVKAPMEFTEDDFLDSSVPELQEQEVEKTYSGFIEMNGEKLEDFSCSIHGVSLCSEDDTFLEIRHNDESFRIKFYAVEKWTYIRRYNTGFDGTIRSYFITPEFDQDFLENGSISENFRAILLDMFSERNHKLYCFSGQATTDFFQLEIDGQKTRTTNDPFALKNNKYSIFLNSESNTSVNSRVYKATTVITQPVLKKFSSPSLSLEAGKTYTPKDRSKIQAVIDSNIQYLGELKTDLKDFKKLSRKSELSRFGYDAVDLLTKVTLLNNLKFPKIKQVTAYGGDIMSSTSEIFGELAGYKEFIYPKLMEITDLKISLYKELIKSFDSSQLSATLPPYAENTFHALYTLSGIPMGFDTIFNGQAVSLHRVTDIPYFPGFFFQTEDGTLLLIFMENSAKKCYSLLKSGKTASEKPLSFNISFTIANLPSDITRAAEIKKLAKKKGTLTWDGKTLSVTAGGKVLFRN